MTDRIIYFTAGKVPSTPELADIQKLNDAAEPAYRVNVMAATGDVKYGDDLKECEFVAGTVPTAYNAKTTIDPDNLPVRGLGPTQVVVNNAASITLLPATGSTPAQGNATAAVAASALTGARLPATSAVVTNGQVINVTGGTVTITVAANVVTAAFTATP